MEANCFTMLWCFLPYVDMNQPRVYMCPLIPNLPPTSLPIPSRGFSQCTSFKALFHALNLDWWSISQMAIYMSQCYSLKSCLCLFCCLAYRVFICLQWGRPGFNPQVGKIPWRRKRLATPVRLPGKFHEWRSLVGYSPWDRKELHTTAQLPYICVNILYWCFSF